MLKVPSDFSSIFEGMRPGLIATYVLSLSVAFLSFNQGDLNHTVGSSYGYVFGHFLDFYDYNKTWFVGNDYFPTLYLLFALWMWPIKLLVSGFEQNGMSLSGIEVLWAKALLALLFFISVFLVKRIAEEIPLRPEQARYARLMFLLSPLALFAVFAFSQYDIVGVTFTLLGVLALVKGKKWQFAIAFAFAISSKYFAALIFLPIVLVAFKRFRDIVALGLVGLSVLFVEALVYLPNAAFRHHTLTSLLGGKVDGAQTQAISYLIATAYLLGCFGLYVYRPRNREDLFRAVFVSASAIYGMMFAVVVWHPQWFVILAPFFALASAFSGRRKLFAILDTFFFPFYVWVVVTSWVGNVDNHMIALGPLREFLWHPSILFSDLLPTPEGTFIRLIFMAYFQLPLIFFLFDKARPVTSLDVFPSRREWWIRALMFPIAFTIPAILTMYIPLNIAEQITPAARAYAMTATIPCNEKIDQPFGEIYDSIPVAISVNSAVGNVSAISFPIGTYGQTVGGDATLSVVNPSGEVIAKATANLSRVKDLRPVYFYFDNALDIPSGSIIEIQSIGVVSGNGFAIMGGNEECEALINLTIGVQTHPGFVALTYYMD